MRFNSGLFLLAGVWGSYTPSLYLWMLLIFARGASVIGMFTPKFLILIELCGGQAKVWANVLDAA